MTYQGVARSKKGALLTFFLVSPDLKGSVVVTLAIRHKAMKYPTKTRSADNDDGRTAIRTHIYIEPTEGGWEATEPAADGDTIGFGNTPPEAVKAYVTKLQEQR